MGQKKAAKPKTAAAANAPAVQSPDPAAAAAPGAAPIAAAAAAAPAVSVSTLHQLEQKKRHLSQQLKDVERQIFDLETRYLEGCNPNANALTGYEGLRNNVGSAKPSKPAAVVQEDRIFSGSSTTSMPR